VALLVLLLLAGLALGRSFFIGHAAAKVSPTVTGLIFDTVIRFLRTGLRWVLLIAAVVSVLLWLVGPARWARWLRAQAARGIRWTGRRAAELGNDANRRRATAGARRGAAWALEHGSGLRLLGVVVAGIVLIFGGNLSVSGVWWTVVGLAIYLVVLELVFAWARRTAAGQPMEAGPMDVQPVEAAAPAGVAAEAAPPKALVAGVVAAGRVPASVPATGPATSQPLSQQGHGGAEDPGDDDDHDQGRPG